MTGEDRRAIREQLGAADSAAIVVVAAKYAQLPDAFRALVTAIGEMHDVLLVVKPHPAEGDARYRKAMRGSETVDRSAGMSRSAR